MGKIWEDFLQWWYPAPFRIRTGSPAIGYLCAELDAIYERLGALSGTGAEGMGTPAAKTSELDKSFVVGLCNNLHRLDRSVARAAKQGSDEAERLKGHLERVRVSLKEEGITYEDLTDQEYNAGRADFEPLGEPQPIPGLCWPTIRQCERPVVLRRGEVLQRAKGVVGTPA